MAHGVDDAVAQALRIVEVTEQSGHSPMLSGYVVVADLTLTRPARPDRKTLRRPPQ
jgi:hypothetical protein